MRLESGSRLGSYEVTGSLGAGGMGEVYRAHDTRLGRDVAIKILPDLFTTDAQRLARFEREARVLASLNHPNIGAIHGLEDIPADAASNRHATKALVLELVDGPTLADLIARGPLPLSDTLAIATQIADALETAHAQGIVHRDLKPANVKVRADGTVKVLDFGLAKSMAADEGSSPMLSASPTITSPAALTGMGVLLGTAAYMSPEQARGKVVDKRADIWAFGCVLYEMLTGRRAFEGEDVSLTLAEVMKSEPEWKALPPDLPARIRVVLERCLKKDPRERLRDIGDVKLALGGAFDALTAAPPAPHAPQPTAAWRRVLPWITGPAIGAGIAALLLSARAIEPPPLSVDRFSVTVPEGLAIIGDPPAISPDGQTIVFAARRDNVQYLYRRDRGQSDVVQIDGTDGGYYPEFSPDGRSLVFVTTGVLRHVDLMGGAPVSLLTARGFTLGRLSWYGDRLLISDRGSGGTRGLMQAPASGGDTREITTVDKARGEIRHDYGQWLPGGDAVLFMITRRVAEAGGSSQEVAVQQISTGERRVLASGTYPYFAGRHIVFLRDDNLWAVPFDPDRLEVTGEPRPLNQTVPRGPGGSPALAVSADGMLVTVPGATRNPIRTLAWVDRDGKETAINAPARAYVYARLSPDNTRVALDVRGEQSDIWIWDLARETLLRLTNPPGIHRGPVWSSDSKRVAYWTSSETLEGLEWRVADASSGSESLTSDGVPRSPNVFSPDGTSLLFTSPTNQPYDIGILTLADKRMEMLLTGPYSEGNAALSPNGRWLAYESTESGRDEIYLRSFPDVQASREQVSTEGGTRPLWSRDGRELLYYVPPDRIMSVSVQSGERLALGRPTVVVQGPYAVPANTGRHYDLSADGKRLLLLKDVPTPGEIPRLEVVLNWFEELRRLAPSN